MRRPIAEPVLPLSGSGWGGELIKSLTTWTKQAVVLLNDQRVGPALASAATLTPSHPIHHVSGVAAISTIGIGAGMTGPLVLIPDGAFTLALGGNIGKASTAVVGQAMTLYYDTAAGKWYPSY